MHASRDATRSRRRTRSDRIEDNRIQKLLTSEYQEFLEQVLVESPFAETNRNGRGIRQVSLGLTPTKLIVAADVFKNNSTFFCPRALDPSIESFELISVYPLEYVTLSVFRRRRRKTLKARFIDGRVNYYEFGGTQRKKAFWKMWCKHVENSLGRKMDGSSLSETTAASSSSTTTLYILSSEIELRKCTGKQGERTMCRVWAHYGGAGDHAPPTWPRKNVYLGPSHEELVNGLYAPVPLRFAGGSLEEVRDELKDYSPSNVKKPCQSWPICQAPKRKKRTQTAGDLCDVLFIRDHGRRYYKKCFPCSQNSPCDNCRLKIHEHDGNSVSIDDATKDRTKSKNDKFHETSKRAETKTLSRKISRFGLGVSEKCSSGLVLGPHKDDPDYNRDAQLERTLKPYALMESGVKVWEGGGKGHSKSSRNSRHLRRYGLCTMAHFLRALGPWTVQPGERDVFQGRRSFSVVAIRRQPAEAELRLPVSRRQLGASVSCTALEPSSFGAIGTTTRGRIILFWTPEYWYRPRPATAAYKELRQHLNLLRNFRQEKEHTVKRKLFSRRKKRTCEEKDSSISTEEKPSLLGRIFSGNGNRRQTDKPNERHEDGTTAQLRRLLRIDFRITVWDLDSTTLAMQLTLIDRDLFTRIPAEEMQILVFQKTPRNAPNLGAWIAFSHRISCLAASEILAVRKLNMRTRIIARLINVANKCFTMGNFHSCRSILAGLQAPPIYRLRLSWSYLRIHHATRYETMEKLCKIFKNPCTTAYRSAWTKAERDPPYIPYVGDLLARLLGLTDPSTREFINYSRAKDQQRVTKLTPFSGKTDKERVKINQDPLVQKQSWGKRIVEAALAKIKFRTIQRMPCKEKNDPLALSRHDLARKYFHRWSNIVLKSRIREKEEERMRKMDPRERRVLDVTSWLTDCQRFARGYEFPGHSYAREFLLKSRYREDRENFFISLKLEPAKIT